MNKADIVILDSLTLGNDVDISALKSLGNVTIYEESTLEEARERLATADIAIVNKVLINEYTLEKAQSLKMVALTATGFNNVDFKCTNERGITVANVSGYSTQSVIQHTFALLFYVMEKLSYYDNYVKSGEYLKSRIFTHFDRTFMELSGKTYGIIGLGEIGRGVANVAQAFGAHVIYYSTSGKNNSDMYERVDFDELLSRSDVVSIHAPLNENTLNLMNYEAFKKMKKNAVLINVGRGPIVNEEDLAKALDENLIAGAGLDVLSEEPMKEDNPLYRIKDSEKLLITPHIAWATLEARQRLVDEVYKNISAFMNGGKRNVVNPLQ